MIPCPYGEHPPDPSCSRCKGTGRWDARDLWEVLRREGRRGLWAGGGSAGEVAGFCNEIAWTKNNQRGGMYMGPDRPSVCHDPGWVASITAAGLATRFAALPWPPVTLTPDASIHPASIPPGTVVYIDWPYRDTTGYKHQFPWEVGIPTAQAWKAAGARVYISEAVPVPIPGWHHVEITDRRKGQARTFSKQKREWLTCSDITEGFVPVQEKIPYSLEFLNRLRLSSHDV